MVAMGMASEVSPPIASPVRAAMALETSWPVVRVQPQPVGFVGVLAGVGVLISSLLVRDLLCLGREARKARGRSLPIPR